jgi:hypothetical protein
MKNWKLEDPDEELNRIVRQAAFCGPQRVTLDDDIQVVVLNAAEYARLTGEPSVADVCSEAEPKVGMFTALRQALEEIAGDEDAYWPWDWDCEKREWVLPRDHALSS